jgi:AcrR family transcriptional regulator
MAGVRQFDEDGLLDTAAKLFWEKGFAATSMQDLAAATRVQRGSLYNAYGGKEALFVNAYRKYQALYMEGVRAALAADDLRDALLNLFAFGIELIRKDRRGCLTTKTATDEQASSPKIREALRRQMGDLEACLTERLAASPERLRLPANAAARLLVTHTRGMVVIERIYDDPQRLKSDAEALIDLIIEEQAD